MQDVDCGLKLGSCNGVLSPKNRQVNMPTFQHCNHVFFFNVVITIMCWNDVGMMLNNGLFWMWCTDWIDHNVDCDGNTHKNGLLLIGSNGECLMMANTLCLIMPNHFNNLLGNGKNDWKMEWPSSTVDDSTRNWVNPSFKNQYSKENKLLCWPWTTLNLCLWVPYHAYVTACQ